MTTPKKGLIASAACAAVAVIACLLVLGLTYRGPAERPKITDWMQGWASIAGGVGGVVAAVFTGALLLFEIRRARQAEEDARQARAEAAAERAQAAADRARVDAARAEALVLPARAVLLGSPGVSGQPSLGLISEIALPVHNFGSGPIRQVRITISSTADEGLLELKPIEVLGPGATQTASQRWTPQTRASGVITNTGVSIAVRFIDLNGRSWERINNGEPRRVDEQPEPQPLRVRA